MTCRETTKVGSTSSTERMARDVDVSRHALKVAVTLAGLYRVSYRATPTRTVSRVLDPWVGPLVVSLIRCVRSV